MYLLKPCQTSLNWLARIIIVLGFFFKVFFGCLAGWETNTLITCYDIKPP